MDYLLFKHQIEAINFAIARDGIAALFHGMGLGKTRTALEIFARLKEKDPGLKLFVICPLSLIEAAWGEDIQKFTMFKYWNCNKQIPTCSNTQPHWLSVDKLNQYDIFIINYEGFISRKFDDRFLSLLRHFTFMAVVDESSRIKNHSSITSKKLLQFRNFFKYRVIMSGTPAPNTELEYWPQITFLRDGILPAKFSNFRNTYFHLERGNQIIINRGQIVTRCQWRETLSQGWKVAITDKNRVRLMDTLRPACHYVDRNEALDLPPMIDEKRVVNMKPKQATLYRQMRDEYIIEIRSELVAAEAALKKMMKLRQITSGFIINDAEENLEIGENPKFDELMDVLEEAGNQQVIIWCQFKHEIRKIFAALGENAVALYSETKDRDQTIQSFKDGKVQYLIAHPRSAAHGLTFTNCHLMIYYSLDYSSEAYEQAKCRTNRPGQIYTCTNIHLLCKDSVDEEILAVLQGKHDKSEMLNKLLRNERVTA